MRFQVTVGLPPDHEVTLSPGQLKSRDLRRIIHNAYGGDESMAMLTQVSPHIYDKLARVFLDISSNFS